MPAAGVFDAWYESIVASPGWDGFVQQALDLPTEVESTGYLTGNGLAEVQQQLALRPGDTLVSWVVAAPAMGSPASRPRRLGWSVSTGPPLRWMPPGPQPTGRAWATGPTS